MTTMLSVLQSMPRTPSELDMEALIEAFIVGVVFDGEPTDDPREFIPNLAVIWDSYTSDGPGYSGPVAMFVWGADHETVTIFDRSEYSENEAGQVILSNPARAWKVATNYGP